MPKYKNTRRLVKHKRRKTSRQRGGSVQPDLKPSILENHERLGVVDNLKNKISDAATERLNAVNSVLSSDQTNEAVGSVATQTANILKDQASLFNNAMNKPEVKAEIKKAISNAGEVASVAVQAAEEPLTELIGVAAKAAPDALSASLSGAIKVGTDALAAVPGVGAVIELGKIANDTSKAVSAVVEASSTVAEASSDAIIDAKNNYDQIVSETSQTGGAAQFHQLNRMIHQTAGRTAKSMSNFNKTKRNNKDRHVRFAV